MKKIKYWFLAGAILLSNMMCAVVAYQYCALEYAGKYKGYSAPANTAFLYAIPFVLGIVLCVVLAWISYRKENRKCRTEKACLTNMCVVMDGDGNVVALDKVTGNYVGTTFPGGHVEHGEILQQSAIREVREETGLEIKNPELCGIYHWYKDGIHHVIFIYKTQEFSGTLKSSEEGQVYWIPLEQFKKKELATGTEHVVEMIESGRFKECYMQSETDGYVGKLY